MILFIIKSVNASVIKDLFSYFKLFNSSNIDFNIIKS